MTTLSSRPIALRPDLLATVTRAASLATGGEALESSFIQVGDVVFGLVEVQGKKQFVGLAEDHAPLAAFEGERKQLTADGTTQTLLTCPLSAANAAALREQVPSLRPRLLGRARSIGMGDRLGIATPGHAAALAVGGMEPIFAQQSMRENERTGRTPQQVVDDATWGAFQAGYHKGYGADADHLKTSEHVDRCIAAGFTFFTIDPSDHVDATADSADATRLTAQLARTRWDALETSESDTFKAYADKVVRLPSRAGDLAVPLPKEAVVRAVVKYGGAVAHVASLYRHLASKLDGDAFELELSVDETDTPTSIAEHYYIAAELKRMNVAFVSLAPRFVGRFEKGVDYIGDQGKFRLDCAGHAAVARRFGGYKLSLHSGSDKFSIYPIVAECTGEALHVKTAGTSYLEALRAIAAVEPDLYREILDFAREHYDEDRRTYHVSADAALMPYAKDLDAEQLPATLDDFHVRQACHVTFGSVLQTRTENGAFLFRDRFMTVLRKHEQLYHNYLAAHFERHIRLCL